MCSQEAELRSIGVLLRDSGVSCPGHPDLPEYQLYRLLSHLHGLEHFTLNPGRASTDVAVGIVAANNPQLK